MGKLILRDKLAIDRTYMANERTLLAFIRTFIGMIASGVALYKVFDVTWAHIVGVIMFVLGPLLLIYGIIGFIWAKKKIKKYEPDDN